MLRIIAAIAVTTLSLSSAYAAPCRDTHGKFTKCPPAAAAKSKVVRCRDAKGHFAKCGTPGAKPA
jgi:hypothetical protein